jgi:hypothetical protein
MENGFSGIDNGGPSDAVESSSSSEDWERDSNAVGRAKREDEKREEKVGVLSIVCRVSS